MLYKMTISFNIMLIQHIYVSRAGRCQKPRVDAQRSATRVPDGHLSVLATRQLMPNEKGFVGYETVWKPFQKEVEYKTPKKP